MHLCYQRVKDEDKDRKLERERPLTLLRRERLFHGFKLKLCKESTLLVSEDGLLPLA